MQDESTKSDLLGVARAVLREELISVLPSEKKYQALMVANAMSIAAREAEQGPIDTSSSDVLKAICQLLETEIPDEEIIPTLINQLREGSFGADTQRTKDLHRLLLMDSRRRLDISNPRYLTMAEN